MRILAKKACICLFSALLLLMPLFAARGEGPAGEVTAVCAYTLPVSAPLARLTDESLLTRITIPGGRSVGVELPACAQPSLYMTWFTRPQGLNLTQYGADGQVLSKTVLNPATPFERYRLDPACRKVLLSANRPWTVSTLRIFDGDLPGDLVCFGAPMDRADLLVVLGQPQALFEELGGLAPLYAGTYGLETAFCFLSEDNAVLNVTAGDPRPLGEALTALWSLGYREAPFLGNFLDHDYNELEDVQKSWNDRALNEYLVRLIRSLRPKILVCAAGGEEDQRSAYAASRIERAVQSAADETQYPDFLPAHAVQKLYVSDPQGETCLSYTQGQVYETALAAYKHLVSRQFYKRPLPREGRFTLLLSQVGPDEQRQDLLENIPVASLLSYAAPTPVPTPTDTPAPTVTPTATSTVTPSPTPTPTATPALTPTGTPLPAPTITPSFAARLSALPYKPDLEAACLTLLAAALLVTCLAPLGRARGLRLPLRPLLAGSILLIVLSAAGFGLLRFGAVPAAAPPAGEAAAPTAVPTAAPSPVPSAPVESPAPTDTPAPSPTQAPTPTPTPDPYPFLPYGEAERVDAFDEEAGSWIYRSDILSVEIRREQTQLKRGPLTYFVAHVYTRDYDSFYSTFASNRKNGASICWPEDMARRYKSVLWINGDNLVNAEAGGKGVLIRDGRIFSLSQGSHSLAYYSETQSFAIISRHEVDARTLWESGTQDVFSFLRGSDLVVEGEISSGARRVTQRNPRTALGMVEPGHFVVIVADGRQPKYSIGMTPLELAQAFLDEGCVLAYNLDGGQSTCLYFLGVKLNHHGNEVGRPTNADSKQRRLPEGLAWGYSPLCGTLGEEE